MNPKINNRIPSLDGLRAISILMVVVGHAVRGNFRFLDFANLGVRVFFVISAYLIVGILLRDVEKNRFSMKTFYFKRFLRTFPSFYFYLIVLFLVLQFFNLFNWKDFWHAPFYLENYNPKSSWNDKQWFVGHTWSLAVEEQFYLLIAFAFYLLNKQIISKSNLGTLFWGIILIVPFIRVGYLYCSSIPDFLRGSINRSFETVADTLAIGGVLALLSQKKRFTKQIGYFKNKIWFLILIILFVQLLNSSWVVADFGLKPRYFYNFIGLTIINVCIALMVIILINYPNSSMMSKFLNHQFMITIGLWSYSIYLWQQVWLYSWDLPLIVKFGGIICCSAGSYYWIEKPFLRWRDSIVNKNEKN